MSHLYRGFRFAGFLPSVHTQREIQGRLLFDLRPQRLLVVGCAYGDELAQLLSAIDYQNSSLNVTAIDLAPVEEELRSQDFASVLGSRLQWMRVGLLDTVRVPKYGRFDIVQCGFVLHDIDYRYKDRAMFVLSKAVRPGGHVIISDIFLSCAIQNELETCSIYDFFLSEADSARRNGRLRENEWRLLVGDGKLPGLLRSKDEALQGTRDFFDTPSELKDRATKAGLEVVRMVTNSVNSRLRVMVMRRLVGDAIDLRNIGG